MVVDIISGLQAVSLHLMGQTSLLSRSPSLLSISLPHSLFFPSLRSAKISSSKQDLIMPIDKMSKYSYSPLEKKQKKNKLSTPWPDSTYTQTHTNTTTARVVILCV